MAGLRIGTNVGGVVAGPPTSPPEAVEEARAAEAAGYTTAWTVHFSRISDALTTLAVAGTRTERIELGVGVVPTYPRHPLALAQQAATAQAFCGGRLTLGIGVSHRPVIEGLHGLEFRSPAAHMREYLQVLVPLLHGEEVAFDGEHHRVHGGFGFPGMAPVPVLVGALSPRMARVAGEHADGVITWLAGPRTLESTIVPALGDTPRRVVAALPVAVTDDPDAAREQAESGFARYAGLENYQRVFTREGVSGAGDLVVAGNEKDVEAQLSRLADIGVTDLWPVVYGVEEERTRALLASLA